MIKIKEDHDMCPRKRRHGQSGGFLSHLAFWTICLMHDNALLPFFRDPYKLLTAAGLKPGMHALEVGCGPGFFTIPAAKILGDHGILYAVDVNPLSIKRVLKKMKSTGIRNIVPICTNASRTDFSDESMDLAFLFGLPWIAGGMENLISELYRTLKPGGRIAYKGVRGSEKQLTKAFERSGFAFSGKQGRMVFFIKEGYRE